MIIERDIHTHVKRLAKEYPVVTITGPRQSGKSTLVKLLFPKREYLNLELPDVRRLAKEDPEHFLARFPDGAVIDEIQNVPELLSYIQVLVDEKNKEGLYIITGSAQFELLEKVTQSLAGRTAIVRLLPFSMSELATISSSRPTIAHLLFKGFYPRLHDKALHPTEAMGFYVNTYIERDVRQILNIKDLTLFERFIRLCAARTGQILNLSQLGNECGINHNTAKSWLSILEASYIVFRLPPHFNNFSKRLVKSPKIYFIDVGLASYLLGIENEKQLETHPLRGHLFETLVVADLLKQRFNKVRGSNLYYFRDNVGNEVDLLIDVAGKIIPLEIKVGATFSEDMLSGLKYYSKLNPNLFSKPLLVYGGKESFEYKDFSVRSYLDIANLLDS